MLFSVICVRVMGYGVERFSGLLFFFFLICLEGGIFLLLMLIWMFFSVRLLI